MKNRTQKSPNEIRNQYLYKPFIDFINNKKDRDKYVALNNFLMRRQLFNQNPNFVDVISNWRGDFSKTNTYKNPSEKTKFGNFWIYHFSRNGKLSKRISNSDDNGIPNMGYDQFFRTLDLTKKIYVDGKSAFHELVDVTFNEEKKKKRQKFQQSFKPLTKKMHN